VRYYEYHLPEWPENKWGVALSLKGERFPKGTRLRAVVTDRDGTLLDSWEIPTKECGGGMVRPHFGRVARGIRSGY
jgi:hypothetical protein